MLDRDTIRWIKDQLTNNEWDSDEEMLSSFISERVPEEEAKEWIKKRHFYHFNLVIEDEDGNDMGVFDPNTKTIKPLD